MARISKILLMFAAFALVACGDEIDTAKTVNDPNMDILAVGESIDQLPCDASNEGKFVYVADSSEVYFCMDGEWIRFNGKDGTDGSDGKDGKDGTDGKDATNGTDGTKCDVLGFEDGFTVVCGKSNVSINLKNLMPDLRHLGRNRKRVQGYLRQGFRLAEGGQGCPRTRTLHHK